MDMAEMHRDLMDVPEANDVSQDVHFQEPNVKELGKHTKKTFS